MDEDHSDADPEYLPEPKGELGDSDDILLDGVDEIINVEEEIFWQSNDTTRCSTKGENVKNKALRKHQIIKKKRTKKGIDENNITEVKIISLVITVTTNILFGKDGKFV